MSRLRVRYDASALERLPAKVLEGFLASWDGRYGCRVCTRAGDARREDTTVGAFAEPGGHQLWFAHAACRPPDEPTPAPRLSLSVAGFVRPGRPRVALVWTVRGARRDVVGVDDRIDHFEQALLASGLVPVGDDWATTPLVPVEGWTVSWSPDRLELRDPTGTPWYDGPWVMPDRWEETAGTEVALFAAADLDLGQPVRSLDAARADGRLVGGQARLARVADPDR